MAPLGPGNQLRVNLRLSTTVTGADLEEFGQDNPDCARVQWAELSALIADGTIDPLVSRVYELA